MSRVRVVEREMVPFIRYALWTMAVYLDPLDFCH